MFVRPSAVIGGLVAALLLLAGCAGSAGAPLSRDAIGWFVAGVAAGRVAVTGADADGQAAPALAPDAPHVELTFATPEEAILHYVEGIAENDAGKILEASAIDEMSEGFDFARYVTRLNAMELMQSPAPAEYAFYRELNKMQLSAGLLRQVRNFAYSLLSGEVIDGRPIIDVDEARIGRFIQNVDPARLAGITVEQISFPSARFQDDPRYLENMAKIAAIYGADEMTDRVALFTFDDDDYFMGFQLLRYGDGWKVSQQSTPLVNLSTLGTPAPITPEAFASMISGE